MLQKLLSSATFPKAHKILVDCVWKIMLVAPMLLWFILIIFLKNEKKITKENAYCFFPVL